VTWSEGNIQFHNRKSIRYGGGGWAFQAAPVTLPVTNRTRCRALVSAV
jgi:hypothetical protein